MTPFALILVLTAAVLHAVWNLWAKRAGGGLPFVYLVGLIICTLYVPVAGGYWLWRAPEITWSTGLWIIGSGVLKTSYALFLQRSYRTGDFSLIYPLARGTGPLLSTLAAILILGERPSALAVGGALITRESPNFKKSTRLAHPHGKFFRRGSGRGESHRLGRTRRERHGLKCGLVTDRESLHVLEHTVELHLRRLILPVLYHRHHLQPAVGQYPFLQTGARNRLLHGPVQQHEFFRALDGVFGGFLSHGCNWIGRTTRQPAQSGQSE